MRCPAHHFTVSLTLRSRCSLYSSLRYSGYHNIVKMTMSVYIENTCTDHLQSSIADCCCSCVWSYEVICKIFMITALMFYSRSKVLIFTLKSGAKQNKQSVDTYKHRVRSFIQHSPCYINLRSIEICS